jgi:hypothetical protein
VLKKVVIFIGGGIGETRVAFIVEGCFRFVKWFVQTGCTVWGIVINALDDLLLFTHGNLQYLRRAN